MRKLWLAVCLISVSPGLKATSITGSAIFDSDSIVPGVFGQWTINYTSTDPAFRLSSVTFNLAPAGLFLDTTFQLISPGALANLDFTPISGGAATGFSSITPSTDNARDGATSFTLNFNDFNSGESFRFEMDVDQCSNSLDPAVSLNCSLVSGAEFAGATATFVFSSINGSYTRTGTFAEILSTNQPWDASTSVDAPEPATFVMLAPMLIAAAARLRRRASRRAL